MSESDPYATSYSEKAPTLANSVSRTAAKRLRKESLSRGNRARQEIEAHAPKWKNEPNPTTTSMPKGSSISFHPGSYEGSLGFNLKRRR